MAGGIGAGIAAAVVLAAACWAGVAEPAPAESGIDTEGTEAGIGLTPGPEPRGPLFGNNAVFGEIRGEGAPDTDDFVGPLVAGERLAVAVRATGERGLRPGIALLDPRGADRTPLLLGDLAGTRAGFSGFVADRTGRWVVRVLGRAGSEGGYLVRFRVGEARPGSLRRRFEGGAESRIEVVPFEAVRGGRLSLRMDPVPAGGLPPLLSVLDPRGRENGEVEAFLRRRGSSVELRDLPLDGEDGTWRLLVGVDGGPLGLTLRASAPVRRRGTLVLDAREPHLDPRDGPLPATAGGLVRFEGAGFSRAPLPRVLVGGREVEPLRAGPAGEFLDVLLPALPRGVPLAVVVANPDGQACEARDHLLVLAPGPAAVSAFLPEALRLVAGETVSVTVLLSRPAPEGGAAILLEVEGPFGAAPASVVVPAHQVHASFPFRAADVPAAGILRATFGTSISLFVEVVPPPQSPVLDLSGWRLVQTDAARSWTLPAGIALAEGASLVVARASSRTEFEQFWATTLSATAVYLDSGDKFPSLNGDETLSLLDRDGVLVDGPTVKLAVGMGYRRVPGAPPGDADSWVATVALPGIFGPEFPPPPAAGSAWVHIAAFGDPSGPGQFVREFVEIRRE